jgi:quercetin dioxygenase-like cupin family protein
MEIRRFGPGHRRAEGPPGTRGVAGALLLSDERAVITEVAFGPYAMITPHSNQANTALFIVIAGGGFVQVGDERARVNHGEAVIWPPGIPHGAYTDGTEMRAIIVELAGDADGADVVDADAVETGASEAEAHGGTPVTKATGHLAERTRTREEYDAHEGEPW